MGLNALSICEVIRGIYDDVDPQEIIKFCEDHLPHYMAPRIVDCHFEDLRKAAGNVQKFILREKEMAMGCLPWGKKII